jgi:hypothetical protein
MLVNLHQPRARADVRVGIQICDLHENNLTTDGHGWTQIKIGRDAVSASHFLFSIRDGGTPSLPEFIFADNARPNHLDPYPRLTAIRPTAISF